MLLYSITCLQGATVPCYSRCNCFRAFLLHDYWFGCGSQCAHRSHCIHAIGDGRYSSCFFRKAFDGFCCHGTWSCPSLEGESLANDLLPSPDRFRIWTSAIGMGLSRKENKRIFLFSSYSYSRCSDCCRNFLWS